MIAPWPTIRFEELYSEPSRNGIYKSSEFQGSGFRIINMGELFGYDFLSDQEMKLIELNENEKERYGLVDGDLLFGRRSLVEEGAGKCSVVIDPSTTVVFESSIIRVRLNKEMCVPLFYYYYFKSSVGRPLIKAIVSGTNVKGIRGSDLKNVEVHLPEMAVQNTIVEKIWIYDNLIENNLRRIELLENAARLIYNEWFVKLNFPGREHTKIIVGVPEGWHEGTVGELATVKSGYAFKSKDWQEDGNPVIKIKNIGENTVDTQNCDCVPDIVTEKAARFRLEAGEMLIAMTGATVGKIGLLPRTHGAYYLNQRVGVFRSDSNGKCPVPFLFSFFNTENAQAQVLNFAAGAAQPNISGGQIEAIKLKIPSNTILSAYLEYTEPTFQQREILLAQNEQLRMARDMLLPKLMSGEIAV